MSDQPLVGSARGNTSQAFPRGRWKRSFPLRFPLRKNECECVLFPFYDLYSPDISLSLPQLSYST